MIVCCNCCPEMLDLSNFWGGFLLCSNITCLLHFGALSSSGYSINLPLSLITLYYIITFVQVLIFFLDTLYLFLYNF